MSNRHEFTAAQLQQVATFLGGTWDVGLRNGRYQLHDTAPVMASAWDITGAIYDRFTELGLYPMAAVVDPGRVHTFTIGTEGLGRAGDNIHDDAIRCVLAYVDSKEGSV